MNERAGVVFSIAKDNAPVPYCTVSKEVYAGKNHIAYFSLAGGTDISAETHPYRKLLLVAGGDLTVYGREEEERHLKEGDMILLPSGLTAGMRSPDGVVYTEIDLEEEENMNEAIQAGKVFKLSDLLPYQEGKIINMDVLHGPEMKLAVLSFGEGTSLSEHAAPGEAIVFALDGKAVIGYEGKEYPIQAGENFHFAKGGRHYVKADGNFKMALLLTLA